MEKKEMIRYGRVSGRKPKNTLYTFRENGLIYFGISRCDLSTDHFERSKGLVIAKSRALKAKEEMSIDPPSISEYNNENKVVIRDAVGLRGVVKVENVKVLLDHFNSIDNFTFNLREKSNDFSQWRSCTNMWSNR